jgi:hypothetical protein
MAERRLHQLPDVELEAVLRGLAPTLAWPTVDRLPGGPDIATTVRTRIETIPALREDRGPAVRRARWFGSSWRPARRALLLALVALLAVAAIAGAVGLGLPGLRLILGDAPPNSPPSISAPTLSTGPSPSGGRLGGAMGLGASLDARDAAALDARAGFPVRLPADPRLGPPGAAFIEDAKGGAVTLLWTPTPDLPATLEPTVGLLLSEFRGSIDQGFFSKAIGNKTTLERLRVGGNAGYWLSGDPHIFFWEGPNGFVDDPRRWVGDVLLWSDGPITYRLETALGRDEAVRIAESLP